MKRLGTCCCSLKKNEAPYYVVLQYKCWHPGGNFDLVACKTSQIRCLTCKRSWRTKAGYVDGLKRYPWCEIIKGD